MVAVKINYKISNNCCESDARLTYLTSYASSNFVTTSCTVESPQQSPRVILCGSLPSLRPRRERLRADIQYPVFHSERTSMSATFIFHYRRVGRARRRGAAIVLGMIIYHLAMVRSSSVPGRAAAITQSERDVQQQWARFQSSITSSCTFEWHSGRTRSSPDAPERGTFWTSHPACLLLERWPR